VVVACYAADLDIGEAAVAALRRLGDPIVDILGPMPYVDLQQLVDPLWEAGAANYFTSVFLDGVPDPAVDTLVEAHGRSAPPPMTSELHVHHLGGAVSRVAEDSTPFAHRRSPFLLNCVVAPRPLRHDPDNVFRFNQNISPTAED
jgi:hypothetical protein